MALNTKICIQQLFDKWFEQGIKDGTFLFRTLDYQKDEHYHATWNVKIGINNLSGGSTNAAG